ncbi:hypothetical protein DFH06DRAFT_1305960 [Mycena polygramma]|nr:hypothetical protein DFH06DRAFT_1305960 [Mycena polygramma]
MPPSSSSSEPGPSPIQILPPELLCYIFTLGIPEQTAFTPAVPSIEATPSKEQSDPWILGGPWIPGQVCSAWRALAVSLPTLWTSITVTNTLSNPELHLLDIQLARSGTAPLDLFIRCTPWARFDPTPFASFMTALESQSSRWRTLQLQFASGCRPPAALEALGSLPLPLLEQVRFLGDGVSNLRNYSFLPNAPALRHVVLGDAGGPSIESISLPWHQITTYKAAYVDASTHIRNLAAATNLVDCDVTFTGLIDGFLRHDILFLPHLRRLALPHPSFLARLTTPALHTLYLIGTVDPVLPFLRRSGRTEALSELTLAKCNTPTSEIIAILRQTCGLTTLALDLSAPSAELVAALVASERLCPALGSLSLTDWKDELDRDAFVEMITSRCRGSDSVRALYAVAIYSGRRRMKTAAFRLRALPSLEVLVMNSKKGWLAVQKWRAY